MSGFCPNGISGYVSVTTTSQAIDISSADLETGVIRLRSEISRCFVRFGTSSVTAADGDLIVPTTGAEVFKIPCGCTHVAFVSDGAAGRVYYTVGQNT